MTVARPGVVRTLLFTAALAALCLAFAMASAPTIAQARGQVCGSASPLSRTVAQPMATASKRRVGPLGWLGARAGTALAEKSFLTGIEWIGALAGHRSAGDQALQQLGEIRSHLNEVSSQLGRAEGQLDHIAGALNNHSFETAMQPLCVIVRQQRTLFRQFYEPLMRAGYHLADVLEGPDPKQADVPDAAGRTLRARVDLLMGDFMRRSALRDDEDDLGTLRDALVPNEFNRRTTILSRYGLVLMGKRFLTRHDSNLIRHLYAELSHVRAIATWMSEEFWSGRGREDLVNIRRHALVNDNGTEERNLPPMIPPGVLIDLGSGPRGSMLAKPMWYAPVDHDLAWLPGHLNAFDPARGGFQIVHREVGQQLETLNRPPSRALRVDGLGDRWRAPTRVQLESLISNGCEADPTDPNRFRDAVRCTNAVTPANGGTIAGYLNRLNEGNDRWHRLFCASRPGGLPCPQGTGPDVATARHVFLWTINTHPERVDCGSRDEGRHTWNYRVTWNTYTGFRTTTNGPVWHAFPQLNGRPQPAWRTSAEQSYNRCGAWIASRFTQVAPNGNLLLRGVLLATRPIEASDLNPVNNIDYMGQWRGN